MPATLRQTLACGDRAPQSGRLEMPPCVSREQYALKSVESVRRMTEHEFALATNDGAIWPGRPFDTCPERGIQCHYRVSPASGVLVRTSSRPPQRQDVSQPSRIDADAISAPRPVKRHGTALGGEAKSRKIDRTTVSSGSRLGANHPSAQGKLHLPSCAQPSAQAEGSARCLSVVLRTSHQHPGGLSKTSRRGGSA